MPSSAHHGYLRRAFSLLEVVIAIGVAATGLVVVLALLPSLLQQQAEVRRAHVALGLPDAVTIELRRLAGPGLGNLAARAGEFERTSSPLRLLASADGTDLREAADDGRPAYFLIELHRFPPGSPLSYDAGSSHLALQARVSWPHRPNGAEASEAPVDARQKRHFNLVVNP